MHWEDDSKRRDEFVVPDDVVDVSFKLICRQLPTTHAWELAQALYQALPWLKEEPEAGIHQIHGATSGNGWERPPDGELIHLSRRSRMHIRVPKHRIEAVQSLTGTNLDIAGHALEVGESAIRPLQPQATVFARYVIMPSGLDEDGFLDRVADELRQRGIFVRKMLCGIGHTVSTPEQDFETRSVMIADLDKRTSIDLQETGIGPGRHLGCGIFLPHKGIKPVGETEDKVHFVGT
jgi:CRISPR-associated protein Cas6